MVDVGMTRYMIGCLNPAATASNLRYEQNK